MLNMRVWAAGLIVVAGSLLAGCSGGGYNAAGYAAEEKDGRLYVFVPGSAEHQRFKRGNEMTRSVTRPAAGPDGMTVVAEPDVNIDKYLASAGK